MPTAKKRAIFGFANLHLRPRFQTAVGTEDKTKQSFADECDINKIMAKYQKTGAIAHFNRHQPEYGFATSLDLAESMRIVTKANEMFADLPSSVRSKFNNQPGEFLDFVQDPDNASEMVELGLTNPKPESAPVDAPAAAEGDPEPPAGSSPPPVG